MSTSSREDLLATTLIEIGIESWRFLRVMERVIGSLDADQQRRAVSRFHYFEKRVGEALQMAEINLVRLDGSQFEPGLAATAINAADFQPHEDLVVDQTIEPVVMGPAGVLRTGTVTVRRASL